MIRHLLGIVAVLLVVVGALTAWNDPNQVGIYAAFLRLGMILAAAWLAWPKDASDRRAWRYLLAGLVVLLMLASLPMVLRWGLLLGSPVLLFLFWPQVRWFFQTSRQRDSTRR